MRGTLCAVIVGKQKNSDELVLDPEGEVEKKGCFAFLFGAAVGAEGLNGEVVWADWAGTFQEDEYVRAVELARLGAKKVLRFIKTELAVKNGFDENEMDLS